ncbi:hypothetical protein F5887DRAFT_922689 [Amanita rubescens]|nr:hypothetical protein F5887DRAFT_922689 [Amanita rubescens]
MTGYSVRRNRVGAFWASANAENAKEAVRALRREFGRKFLITLEGLITSSATSPVIRERLLLLWRSVQISIRLSLLISVKGPKDSGFRRLWKKVKPVDKPEEFEGVPFDIDDATSNAPTGPRHSQNVIPEFIPPEEVIRRSFQECSISMGNAALLSDALVACQPERLKSDAFIRVWQASHSVSRDFEHGCRISMQNADYLRSSSFGRYHGPLRVWSIQGLARSQLLRTGQRPPDEDGPTTEEKLLGELLKANEGLQFVLKQYKDLERVAVERRTEDTSGIDPRVRHVLILLR